MVTFGPQVCGSLAAASSREWLVADGRGGYATGTVAGLRTRRYHGLLVLAGSPLGRRWLALAGLDAVVQVHGRGHRLATHAWQTGAVDPAGHTLLQSFSLLDGVPRWTWRIGEVVFERELAAHVATGVVAVTHRVAHGPADGVEVSLTPLCTWRDAHGGRRAGDGPLRVEPTSDGFTVEGAYRLRAERTAGHGGPAAVAWEPGGEWYLGALLREEASRGLDAVEDLWAAGRFTATLRPGEVLSVVAGSLDTAWDRVPAGDEVAHLARQRARAMVRAGGAGDATSNQLTLAADQFVVATPTGPAVVAGYPWFGEWTRDTMLSYEGLLLVPERHDDGRAVLRRAAAAISQGMLVNSSEPGAAGYGAADATLWFVHAVGRHVDLAGDDDLAIELLPVLHAIVEHHVAGTRFGIGVDPSDGLLRQGEPGWALTWMDARVDGVPVTPRHGKAVDVCALWIAALGTVRSIEHRLGRAHGRWLALERAARAAFARRFGNRHGGLFDVVDAPCADATPSPDDPVRPGTDPALRPNQLLALSLPHGPGGDRSVVEVCRRHLLTPLGLRSLAPGSPGYAGRHRGGPVERDRAYHQGTVWPWLIGPYVDAGLRVGVDRDELRDALAGLELHLGEWGLGSVSETAEGDAPHAATGCPFQAWSVAELLRARRLLGA